MLTFWITTQNMNHSIFVWFWSLFLQENKFRISFLWVPSQLYSVKFSFCHLFPAKNPAYSCLFICSYFTWKESFYFLLSFWQRSPFIFHQATCVSVERLIHMKKEAALGCFNEAITQRSGWGMEKDMEKWEYARDLIKALFTHVNWSIKNRKHCLKNEKGYMENFSCLGVMNMTLIMLFQDSFSCLVLRYC